MIALLMSNYFPPYARGGYEQWCAEVAVELQTRGHEVHIATGREPGKCSPSYHGIPVHRILNLEAQPGTWQTAYRFFFQRKKLERESLTRLRDVVDNITPDVAFIWGMWNVPRSIPALIERLLPDRVAYYFCDYWPTLPSAYEQYWQTPSSFRLAKAAKRWIGQYALRQLEQSPPALHWQHCYCVSASVCHSLTQSAVPLGKTKVVYGGTRIEDFEAAHAHRMQRSSDDPLRVLYAGRLTPDKGVHTVTQALNRLPHGSVTLTICGDDRTAYAKSLKEYALEKGLADHINFTGLVPRSDIPMVMGQHDVLVFPSIWAEPFARTVIEGMAAGLIVVGTTTGGTSEILMHRETGLTFPAGGVEALAEQIHVLLGDADLRERLSNAARQMVQARFQFGQMVDALEAELVSLCVTEER